MKVGSSTIRSKEIDVYKPDGTYIATYLGFSNTARALNVRTQNVYKACNGYKTTLNGYIVQFKKDEQKDKS